MPWMMVTSATVYRDTRALHVWKMSMSVWKIPVSVRMVEHVTTDTDPTCKIFLILDFFCALLTNSGQISKRLASGSTADSPKIFWKNTTNL